jgi:hypothetical protein
MAGSYLDSSVMLQKESAWGTPVTSGMTKIPVLVWDVNPAFDIRRSQQVTGAAGASAPTWGVKRVTGSMTLEGGYGAMDHVLYGVLGAGAAVSGAGPYVNRYTPAASMPSFTAHVSYGNLPTSKVIQFEGLKFNSVDLSFDAAQGFLGVACDLIGEDSDSNNLVGVTPGTIAATVVHYPINVTSAASVTTLDIGVGSSEAYCVRSGNIKIDRQLSSNRICLGVDTIKEPVPTSPMAVTGTFNIEWADLAAFDAFTDHTVQTTTQFKWTDATYDIDIIFPKLVYSAISTPIQQGDSLVSAVSWEAYGTSGTGVTAEPVNVTITSPINYTAL